MSKNNKVKVLVRTRPTSQFAHDMIDLQDDRKTIDVHCKRDSRRGVVNNQILDWSFRVDGILHNASQEHVFQNVASDIVTSALDGYNGTLMCYGQTGAGKTFTMTGVSENYKHRGLIPRSIAQIYREIEERAESAVTIRISYLEIYNETMFDLLATLPDTPASLAVPQMTVVEDDSSVYVKGLSCHLAQNEEEALNLLFEGETNRAIAEHQLNNSSSRSHCIFTVYIESRSRVQSDARYTRSKLNFVDLAGSERLSKTRSEGKVQQEAMYINKSLTFLEQTVIALAEKNREHVPFRQTKLTHCLKDSIGGTSNTLLIANVWGESSQIEETISTLRFASRMMRVKMEPAMQEHFDPTIMVRKLEKEIQSLKRELAMHDTLTNRSQVSYDALSEQQRYEIKQQVRQFLEGALDEIDIVNVRQIQGTFDAFKEICGQMERDVEERLRQKYMLVDRSDPASIAAAQQAVDSRTITPEGPVGRRASQARGRARGGRSPRLSVSQASPEPPTDQPEPEPEVKPPGYNRGPRRSSVDAAAAAFLKKGAVQGIQEQTIEEGTPGVQITDEGELVGEPDGSSFGIGPAPGGTKPAPSSVVNAKKKEKEKRGKSKDRASPAPKASSPAHSQKEGSTSLTPSGDKHEREEAGTPTSSAGPGTQKQSSTTQRPSTPPPRPEAFEEFKKMRGSEINRILNENKEVLANKKKNYADLARQLNFTKMELDKSREKLENMKRDRESQGQLTNEDGDIIISEEEYMEIRRLKDLKQAYRVDFDELKNLKSEVMYCQKLVDQTRQKLISEFDNWYSESFLVEGEPQTSATAGFGTRAGVVAEQKTTSAVLEDEQEKFNRLQMNLLLENPDSAAFYNARMQTERRKTYQAAMSQPQPSLNRKPGTPTRMIRNPPPTQLQIH